MENAPQSDATALPIEGASPSTDGTFAIARLPHEQDAVKLAARNQIDQIADQPRLMEQGGIRFAVEAICHLVGKQQWTKDALRQRLPSFMPSHNPTFVRRLLDLLIGTNPDTHPIYEEGTSGILACHQ